MIHRSIVWGLVGLLVWSARGVAEEPAKSPPLEVKLIEAGEQPRRALRYQIKSGAHEDVLMTMKMGMATEINGQKLPSFQAPTMEMTMKLDVKDARSDEFDYGFELTETKLLDDEPVMEPVRKVMTDALMKTIGLGGEATVNDQGRTLREKMNVPETAPPDVRQVLDSMQRSVQNIGAPLPDEPVGVGAVWEAKIVLESGGLQIKQVAKYTLTKVMSDSFDADVTIKQSAEKQQMKLPNLPAGTTVELQSYEGQGTGTVTSSLNQLVPNSKMEIASVLDAVITVGGMQQPMKASNKIAIGIRPK